METKYREKFYKDIDSITDNGTLSEVVKIIANVEMAKKPQDIKNIKKLSGEKSAFRIRIGKYRIGIYIVNGVVEFTRILHRDKIYKFFPD